MDGMGAADPSFCDAAGWRVAWRDEFDAPTLDERWWNVLSSSADDGPALREGLSADCRGAKCDLLGGCREAACTRDSVAVRDGRLVLTSRRRRALGRNFTTGAVTTRDRVAWRSGGREVPWRLCVSAVLPGAPGAAAGVWPAHWLLPNDDSCNPDEGEMDVMEMVDGDGTVYSTYHWQAEGAPKCDYPRNHSHVYASAKLAPGWNGTLHEFAVERGAVHVAFALDGQVLLNATSADPKPAHRPRLVDARWFLLLNTAIGGGWPGPPQPATALPVTHEIDYVRWAVRA